MRMSLAKLSNGNGMAKRNNQIGKVIADLNIKTAEKAVKIKAKTKHYECYIYSWEWQDVATT